MDRERDIYDQEIDTLMEGPIELLGQRCGEAWVSRSFKDDSPGCSVFDSKPAMRLFYYCTPTGSMQYRNQYLSCCGCLTQVKGNPYSWAWTDELTDEIRRDPLIPASPKHIKTREQLERFAYWQRRLDREIRNPQDQTTNA